VFIYLAPVPSLRSSVRCGVEALSASCIENVVGLRIIPTSVALLFLLYHTLPLWSTKMNRAPFDVLVFKKEGE
jgi:hypothetical protein